MKSFVSSMAILPRAFMAAIVKSLLRGKSLIGLLFAFWTSTPNALPPPSSASGTTAPLPSPTLAEFLAEAEELILGPYATNEDLLRMSAGLKAQFRECLASNGPNMLPSYSYRLPTGRETGRFLAIDMGGTTLRIALVELRGRDVAAGTRVCEVLRTNVLKADATVKGLVGRAFFEWMADRILDTVFVDGERWDGRGSEPLPMALTWSFPIEQTSIKTGLIGPMGKGFCAADGLEGQDLNEVITTACRTKGLDVKLQAILNDSTACLLSQSYANPSTRFGLILGTGSNVAGFLPVSSMLRAKYGERSQSWFDEARHVVVNTEVSMYGRGVLPLTRWDMQLKDGHERPWFQPLEHMCSGMYLGECCRLPLVEAIRRTGIFGGVVPASLEVPYALNTEVLANVESDDSPDFESSISAFSSLHPSSTTPTPDDMRALKKLASLVARRSSAIIATAVFSLWKLRGELSLEHGEVLLDAAADAGEKAGSGDEAEKEKEKVREALERESRRTTVAFNGAVIESYPGYLGMCQGYVDGLVGEGCRVELAEARDSSLLGAAVAVACESASA